MTARKLALALAAGAAAAVTLCAAVIATAASPDTRWRDVLDTPATPSALAPRALLNGLARAGQRVVAVGQRGHVLYSDDAGQRWAQAQVPVGSDLVAVSFADAKHGWAVGHDGVVLHTSDGGQHWELQLDGRRVGALMTEYYTREAATLAPEPERAAALLEEARRFASQGADNPLLDVWFRDASNGVVVGAFGLALRTNDGGKSWQPLLHLIDNPKGMHLYAVRGIGADLYIVGEQGLAFRLERDAERGAGRFTTLELPYKGTLFGVVGNERALVVHGLRGSVLRSTDAGRSWQTIPTGLQVGMTASALDARGRFMLVSQSGHLLVSTDDGASFAAARLERPVPAAAVVEAARGAVVVAGPRGAQALALP